MEYSVEITNQLLFAYAGLLFTIIVATSFFLKKKIKTLDNIIYKWILICTIFQLTLDLINSYLVITEIEIYTKKVFDSLYTVWGGLVTIYFYIHSKKEKREYIPIENHPKKKELLKFTKIILIITAVAFTIGVILPIYPDADGRYIAGSGPHLVFCYSYLGVHILSWIYFFIKTKNPDLKKDFMIISISMIIGAIGILVQFFLLDSLLITCAIMALFTNLIYFTIGNPDLEAIEKISIASDASNKANKAKSEFLSSMTHEIRTPLNAIVGFSEALSEEELPESEKEDVNIINVSAVNLLEIVNGILDISKIEAGKLEVIKQEYILNKMINEVSSQARKYMGNKKIELNVEVKEGIPQLLSGDVVKIKQVINNLLTNAIKYTQEGEINLEVDSISTTTNSRLIITVEDSGVGIQKESLDNLFTSYQTMEDGTIKGTGLGVALSKQLVELMGGHIHVKSKIDEGTSFIFSLDQAILAETSNKVEGIYASELTVFDCSGKKVLIVDDNGVNLKVAKRLIQEYKPDIELATSGQECIDKVKESKYDLILLDDFMPNMNGRQTLENLQKIEGFKIPVVALTANNESDSREKYKKAGFNDFLSKPIVKEELSKVLRTYLK